MSSSLKGAVQQPIYTKASILQGLRSSKGRRIVWVVVEDIEDKLTYEKFAESSFSNIKTSEDESGHKGCEKVEKIVSEIRAAGYKNVIGIRDSDYIRYQDEPYVCPDGVFLTDVRDLEMMLIESRSVTQKLSEEIETFPQVIQECLKICRLAGYARIMNHVLNLGCSFKKNVKLSKFWDFKTHSFVPDWEIAYLDLFLMSCNSGDVSIDGFKTFVKDRKLSLERDFYICQGHDVMDVFAYKMVHNMYAQDKMLPRMIESYSFEDFKSTNLYRATDAYLKGEGLSLWV